MKLIQKPFGHTHPLTHQERHTTYREQTYDTSGTQLSIHQEQIIDTSRTIHRSNMLIIQTYIADDARLTF